MDAIYQSLIQKRKEPKQKRIAKFPRSMETTTGWEGKSIIDLNNPPR